MNKDVILLRQFIGQEFDFEGERLKLIAVLDDGPSIVLQSLSLPYTIENTAYGQAYAYSPQYYTLPIYSELGNNWHTVLQALFAQLDENP